MNTRHSPLLLLSAALLSLAGCLRDTPVDGVSPATRPVTDVDPKLADPEVWWSRPAVAAVPAGDFDTLWNASLAMLRKSLFFPDRQDRRSGLITSQPVTAAQAFEPWRPDNATSYAVARSTIATYRRTIRVAVTKTTLGGYTASVKVLIEKQSTAGARVSGTFGYQQAISPDQTGLSARDFGPDRPPLQYWYPYARDTALERDLSAELGRRVNPR